MTGPLPDAATIIGSGLIAERERLGLIASNIANADSIAAPGGQPYRAMEPVFVAEPALAGSPADVVKVAGVVQSDAPARLVYAPGNPFADPQGYVHESNVDPAQQMTDLISATQSYAAGIAVLSQSTRLDQAMLQSFIA
ncbi:MAG: flagellar basal body rod protein FlgC [Paracoccaceae bacterium]|nr:flagellar basal body rod protein FlgC [Paracoccaceae bacterium]